MLLIESDISFQTGQYLVIKSVLWTTHTPVSIIWLSLPLMRIIFCLSVHLILLQSAPQDKCAPIIRQLFSSLMAAAAAALLASLCVHLSVTQPKIQPVSLRFKATISIWTVNMMITLPVATHRYIKKKPFATHGWEHLAKEERLLPIKTL